MEWILVVVLLLVISLPMRKRIGVLEARLRDLEGRVGAGLSAASPLAPSAADSLSGQAPIPTVIPTPDASADAAAQSTPLAPDA